MKKSIHILIVVICSMIINACNKEDDPINPSISGCTNNTACNYESTATDDDGSCTYAEAYYDCDGNCLIDTNDDGVCDELEIEGCTDETAINYDPDATLDDESCIILGCMDLNAENYNTDATNDDGSCEYSNEYILNGTWNIISLEYSTLLDLEVLQQNIAGEAYDAGIWSFNSEAHTYSLDLNFDTEPFVISIPLVGDYDVPSFPVENSSDGTWVLNDAENEITTIDTNTNTEASYTLISITNAIAVIQGVLPFEAMGVEQDIDVDMVLEKQ